MANERITGGTFKQHCNDGDPEDAEGSPADSCHIKGPSRKVEVEKNARLSAKGRHDGLNYSMLDCSVSSKMTCFVIL